MRIRQKEYTLSVYCVMREYEGGIPQCITFGRGACYINTPKRIYYNKDRPLQANIVQFLNCVLCKY